MLRHILIVLITSASLFAQGPNPPAGLGTTHVHVQAHGVGKNQVVTKDSTVTVEVTVQVADEHHSYNCHIQVTNTLGANTTTKEQAVQDLMNKIKDEIADCLAAHGQPRADADKFLDDSGNLLIIRATPAGEGHNSGTVESPKFSPYDGKCNNKPRTRTVTK